MTDYLTVEELDELLDELERVLSSRRGYRVGYGVKLGPATLSRLLHTAREYARIRDAKAEADAIIDGMSKLTEDERATIRSVWDEIAAAGGYEEDGG